MRQKRVQRREIEIHCNDSSFGGTFRQCAEQAGKCGPAQPEIKPVYAGAAKGRGFVIFPILFLDGQYINAAFEYIPGVVKYAFFAPAFY